MFKKVIPGLLIVIIMLMILITVNCISSTNTRIYIATIEKGILVSENDGNSWSSFNKGLPEKILPIRIYITRDMIIFNNILIRFI